MLYKVSSLNWYKKKWGSLTYLELYMLKNSLLRVPKKAFFFFHLPMHTLAIKNQNDIKKNQKNITLNQPRWYLDRVKRIWYLSPMRAAKVQASLRIRAVSPEPPLLAYTSSESRGTFRQKARSLAPLNGWACAVKICHDGMLEDTDSLDGAHLM